VQGLLFAAAGLTSGLLGSRGADAQQTLLTASGAGVNVKMMPDVDGNETVPLRESFAFDPKYAQCIVEDNPERFAMETFAMGRAVIEPHQFFMAMHSTEMDLITVRSGPGGALLAQLTGVLGCSTEAGTSEITVGSRTAREPAFFEIVAVDGGHGGGAVGDSFAFTVFFDPNQAPINHAIFGPRFTFTGEMIDGEVTIGPPTLRPVV
jgi:hypothetical protein